MTTITKQIKDLLQDDAINHSLSKEALTRMLVELRTLNEDCHKLNTKNEELLAELKLLRERNKDLEDDNKNLEDDNKGFLSRMSELDKREMECLKLEIRNKYEQRRGDEFYDLTHKIFENRIIRENVQSSYPVKETYTTHPNGSTSGESHTTVNESKQVTREEK